MGYAQGSFSATVSLLTPAHGVEAQDRLGCFLALLTVLGRGSRRIPCPIQAHKWPASGGILLSLSQGLDDKIPKDFEHISL